MKKGSRGTPPLTTRHLTLDRLADQDSTVIFESMLGSGEVTKWMFMERKESLEECRDFIQKVTEAYDRDKGSHHWAIRKNSKCIGMIALILEEQHNRGRLAYMLAEEYWGRGYMAEALKAVMEYGFQELKLHRIEADHFAENTASGKVLEKAGMKREGVSKEKYYKFGTYHDAVIYGLIRQEWKKS